MGTKSLIFVLAAFVTITTGIVVCWQITTNQKEKVENISCTGQDERWERGQTGKYWCRKLLPDRGKVCTAGSQCLSGYCMTVNAQAKSGKCYESKTNDYCLWGETIEKSRLAPKGTLLSRCVF